MRKEENLKQIRETRFIENPFTKWRKSFKSDGFFSPSSTFPLSSTTSYDWARCWYFGPEVSVYCTVLFTSTVTTKTVQVVSKIRRQEKKSNSKKKVQVRHMFCCLPLLLSLSINAFKSNSELIERSKLIYFFSCVVVVVDRRLPSTASPRFNRSKSNSSGSSWPRAITRVKSKHLSFLPPSWNATNWQGKLQIKVLLVTR